MPRTPGLTPPFVDDVLKARLKTTGIVEHTFSMTSGQLKGHDWKIYDVGGARHQRQAWAPYFDDGAQCILVRSFLLALSPEQQWTQ